MQSRFGQPTRARDVLRYLSLVDLSGDPSSAMVACVLGRRERARADRLGHMLGAFPGARPKPRPVTESGLTYGHYAQAVGGWHEGGPGDLLWKAIAVAELADEADEMLLVAA